jgi:ubiquinone/menaquinone biosynthesis C-methylase UbiE
VNESRQTSRVRAIYQRLAPRYDRNVRWCERLLGLERERRWIASFAEGDVLEIGIGTGRNLAYYPPKGVEVTGIDLSSAMLAVARRRADELGRKVVLRNVDAERLEFPDEHFETIVITLVLCTIPNDGQAVAEAKRVLRPGGRLLLLEHVRSPHRIVRGGQRLLAPLFFRFHGDHLLREPLEGVRAEGFEVEKIHRSRCGIIEKLVAKKPAKPSASSHFPRTTSSFAESASSGQDPNTVWKHVRSRDPGRPSRAPA